MNSAIQQFWSEYEKQMEDVVKITEVDQWEFQLYRSAQRAIFWSNFFRWFWRIAIGSCVFMAGYATTWWLLQVITR